MAQLMESVVGHDSQKSVLTQAIKNNTLPHALVFAGVNGVGKQKLALALAQALVCESSEHKKTTGAACGVCGSCVRVAKKQSENLRIIEPVGSAQIKIDQVRDILDFLSFANEGQNRIIIINEAQALNQQAANALLKTLEEPPENVFFILVTTDVRLLMPTIRSRTQVLLFKVLTAEQLKLINGALPNWVYQSARGQAGRLIQLVESETNERRQADLIFYENFWLNNEFLHQFDVKEQIKDRQSAMQTVRNWAIFTRDLILCLLGEEKLILNSDQLATYRKLKTINIEKLYEFSQFLVGAEKDLEKVDMALMFESMWVKYARVD